MNWMTLLGVCVCGRMFGFSSAFCAPFFILLPCYLLLFVSIVILVLFAYSVF